MLRICVFAHLHLESMLTKKSANDYFVIELRSPPANQKRQGKELLVKVRETFVTARTIDESERERHFERELRKMFGKIINVMNSRNVFCPFPHVSTKPMNGNGSFLQKKKN